MKRLSAISMMDTIIAMVLSGIVLGMCGLFLSGLNQTMQRFNETLDTASDFRHFFFLLKHDIEECKSIYVQEGNLVFRGTKNSGNRNQLNFHNDYVVRIQNSSISDTFSFSCPEPEFYFGGRSCVSGEMCDEIILPLKSEKGNLKIHLMKNYTVSERIQFNHGN